MASPLHLVRMQAAENFGRMQAVANFGLLPAAAKNEAERIEARTKDPIETKLISLAPSNTELIFSLGAGKQLLAVSELCDFPPEARSKFKVGNLTSLKMEKITSLQPDFILLVSGQESLAGILKKHGFHTLTVDNSSLGNISKNLLLLGKVSGHSERAIRLAADFEEAIRELRDLTKSASRTPQVLVCIWPQPLMSAGKSSFMSQAITICGGSNCTGDLPQAYPRINPERLLLLHPDIILIPQELARERFWQKLPWSSMEAVKSNHVYVLPQHETDCLMRPTLRLVDALYWLTARFHPELRPRLEKWKINVLNKLKTDSPGPENFRH